MNNSTVCICPKRRVGQGWFDGVWREGRMAAPLHHEEACPKFEDNSHAPEAGIAAADNQRSFV